MYTKQTPMCIFDNVDFTGAKPTYYEIGKCLASKNADFRTCCEFYARDLLKAGKQEVVINARDSITPSSNAQKAQIAGINSALGQV